jgi:hypothetical protein
MSTPPDCFETFPSPGLTSLKSASATTDRRDTAAAQKALTATYNRFHPSLNPLGIFAPCIRDGPRGGRRYGWTDLDLGHGFHETKQRVRFTISEAARREVLQRLLKLNHERYAEEVKQGLHDKKKSGKKPSSRRKRQKPAKE